MAYRTVIFDMDGTLLDTLEDMLDSVNVTMAHFGYSGRTLDEVRCFVGNGAGKLIERSLPGGRENPRYREVLDFYLDYYGAHAQDKTAPYPGIPELLSQLRARGVKVAVVSNKPDGAVGPLARRYFPGLCPVAIGQRPGAAPKPAPDSVQEALRLLGSGPEGAVYVGDSEVDVATAWNAGLPCICVTWGFREEAALRQAGAAVFAATAAELLKLLT